MDKLLASPQYGERWARHWLDLARYADSDGFEFDRDRPEAWRYRDYVVKAFNDDKPYDRFVKEQLAGDEYVTKDTPAGSGHAKRLSPPVFCGWVPQAAAEASAESRIRWTTSLRDDVDDVSRDDCGLRTLPQP